MLLVGLTGNIGSGKSTVAQLSRERGATIIDADVLARRAVELGTRRPTRRSSSAGARRSSRRTGCSTAARCGASCSRDHERARAAQRDRAPRGRADARPRSSTQARKRGDRLVVCDIPLLFERQHDRPRSTASSSSTHRGPCASSGSCASAGSSETEAMDMIAAQMPAELKRARADFVIDNVGTLDAARRARGTRCGARSSRPPSAPRRPRSSASRGVCA